MTDFDYEVMQKKRIAHSARRRKCGSKSKRCTLPSDRLTDKQIKERCGPVIRYNLSKPMQWNEFKVLSNDTQKEYLSKLQEEFNTTAVDLGKMFGVQPLTVRKHVLNNELNIDFPKGRIMSASQKVAWQNFLNGGVVPKDAETDVQEGTGSEPTEPVVFNFSPPEPEQGREDRRVMSMKQFSVRFTGRIDADMIANSLKLILGDESDGDVEIVCNLQ